MKEKQEKAARWKTFGIAALLWAGLAAAFSVLFPARLRPRRGWRAFCATASCCPWREELIFRGAALRLLQPLGKNAAIAGQAVLFAAMHGSWTAKAYALGWALSSAGQPIGGEPSARPCAAYLEQWDRAGRLSGRKENTMTDYELMGAALAEAEQAAALGEVPVGAVVARDGEIIAAAHNTRETEKKRPPPCRAAGHRRGVQKAGRLAAVAV